MSRFSIEPYIAVSLKTKRRHDQLRSRPWGPNNSAPARLQKAIHPLETGGHLVHVIGRLHLLAIQGHHIMGWPKETASLEVSWRRC